MYLTTNDHTVGEQNHYAWKNKIKQVGMTIIKGFIACTKVGLFNHGQTALEDHELRRKWGNHGGVNRYNC